MRVITGSARGRKLLTLGGEEVRPTPERVKEAVFSVIQFQIEGRSFLDLFAGSGQMGIEALSRGARKSVFVDARRESIETVKKNLENTGLKKMQRWYWQTRLLICGNAAMFMTWLSWTLRITVACCKKRCQWLPK